MILWTVKRTRASAFRLILSMTGENAEAQPVGIAFLQLRNIACHLAEIGIGTALVRSSSRDAFIGKILLFSADGNKANIAGWVLVVKGE